MDSLRSRLKVGARLPGIWLTLCAPSATEIASGAGAGWLLLDMEHAPNDLSDVVHHLRAAQGAEMVVRPPEADQAMTKRLMDIGVRNLMFPMVQSAQDAARAVSWTRYAPNGVRGFSTSMRANRYGRDREYLARHADEICVIVQVETPEAIAEIAAIGAVDGVNAIFIGPADLAASMGHAGDTGGDAVQDAIAGALEAIHAAGLPAGILGFGEDVARRYLDLGFDFVAAAGDGWSLARQLDSLMRALRD